MKKKGIVYTVFLIYVLIIFILFKQNQIKTIIKKEEKISYYYFDSYSRQFGYPSNKQQFDRFIDYYESVNSKHSDLWRNKYVIEFDNDSIRVIIKSIYYINNISVLKIKKRSHYENLRSAKSGDFTKRRHIENKGF